MKKYKYNLADYKDLIDLVNKHIKENDISINFIAKTFDIKYQHLIRILRMEHRTTDVNILDIFDFVLKIEKNNFGEKTPKKDFHYKNKCIEKTLYLLSILNEIENYEDFFKEVLYLVHDENLKEFDSCVNYLVKNKIIRITENKMIKDINFHTVNLSKRSSILLINNSILYFEDREKYKKAYQLSLLNKNCKKREMFLFEYIYGLYMNYEFHDIDIVFYNHFLWLKKHNMRKSKILKLFYLSTMVTLYNTSKQLSKQFIYIIYFNKNAHIMENIFSTNYNNSFNFDSIYALENKLKSKYPTFSYIFMLALIDMSDLYINLNMHKLAISFKTFILSKIASDNYYYTYFFTQNQNILFFYGNMQSILNYIKSIQNLDSETKEKKIFFFNYLYNILNNSQKDIKSLKTKLINFYKRGPHNYTAINNFYEANIVNTIINQNYLFSIGLLISFPSYKNVSNINESYLYIMLVFIQILKNRKYKVLSENIYDIYPLLEKDPFYTIFEIPEKDTFYSKCLPVFTKIPKKQSTGRKKFSLYDFYVEFFPICKKYFTSLKSKYYKAQQNLNKNKQMILKSMKNKLIEDGYLKMDSKKNYDIVSIFVNRYPEDNEILRLFHNKNSNEDVFKNFIFIREYNFLTYFLNQMIRDFCRSENYPLEDEPEEKEILPELDGKTIQKMMESNFDFPACITDYFEDYLLELETRRKTIEAEISSTLQEKNINMTGQLLSLFNDDVDGRFLRFTKAYISAKY